MNMHEMGHLYKKHTKIGSPNSLGSCLGTENQTKFENRNMNMYEMGHLYKKHTKIGSPLKQKLYHAIGMNELGAL